MRLQLESLPGLALFACVVRHGSMSSAAKELGLSRSSVSKQLTKFEQHLGARLLQRTTRQLALTELGEEVWREAQAIELALDNVAAITDNYQQHVKGRLKVSCSSSIGRAHLLPLLPEFMQQYPEIDLVLLFEDRMADLAAEQIDLAIRIGHLPDSSLVARKLGELERQLVASPAYLAKNPAPSTPQALTQHNCLCYRNNTTTMDVWRFMANEM
nr:LysR substrate-binding domain-containing protein [uncultured Deefgea sp.]